MPTSAFTSSLNVQRRINLTLIYLNETWDDEWRRFSWSCGSKSMKECRARVSNRSGTAASSSPSDRRHLLHGHRAHELLVPDRM